MSDSPGYWGCFTAKAFQILRLVCNADKSAWGYSLSFSMSDVRELVSVMQRFFTKKKSGRLYRCTVNLHCVVLCDVKASDALTQVVHLLGES